MVWFTGQIVQQTNIDYNSLYNIRIYTHTHTTKHTKPHIYNDNKREANDMRAMVERRSIDVSEWLSEWASERKKGDSCRFLSK